MSMVADPRNFVILSCPAQVVTGGGYLVSDRKYCSTTITTSARFYACYDQHIWHDIYINKPLNDGVMRVDGNSGRSKNIILSFISPQFLHAKWCYIATYTPGRENKKDGDVSLTQIPNIECPTTSNKYVEIAAIETLRVAFGIHGTDFFDQAQQRVGRGRFLPVISIILLGDNDFYRQPKGKAHLPRFNPLDITIDKAQMNGLGSSEAMVITICAAILYRLAPGLTVNMPAGRMPMSMRQLIHNLAQHVHCTIEGKIDTGVKISASSWGTQVYRRLSEKCLEASFKPAVAKVISQPEPLSTCKIRIHSNHDQSSNPQGSLQALLGHVHHDGDYWHDEDEAPRVKPVPVPPMTTMLFASIEDPDRVPVLAQKVIDFRKSNPTKDYKGSLLKMSKQTLERTNITSRPISDSDTVQELFENLGATMKEIRTIQRKMTEMTGMPIEPPVQTELLDASEKLPGVIGAGIPGVGGHDAIHVLVFSPQEKVNDQIYKLWGKWTKSTIRPLSEVGRWDGVEATPTASLIVQSMSDVKVIQKIVQGQCRMSTRAAISFKSPTSSASSASPAARTTTRRRNR
ncbi:uncharacterized protein MELLADRAFT_114905 [Melampsora larici-populina 98AG31]|uniref:Uncharacterized protein n=1 Tax=Melampsora larici-populina (strain 98AG31 / pathotype 3-4-7) TaxID=747676 RepID=F4R496_MELLP|nr:uncharacterized protein MELLADRAFT_114905 [Melampsora larici-populina 98AG31]EGG12769.1 hypothetical protein MELLADRAFT_114905 [Melampsora larici-populina 98AG31]